MMWKEVTEVCMLINSDKITRSLAAFILLSALLIAVFCSALSAFFILFSYVGGFVVCGFLLKYQTKASSYLQRLASIYKGHFSPSKKLKEKTCAICEGTGCSRHQHNNKAPWKNLHIDKKLNDAVEHFFDRILHQYIISWYINYTNDKSFICELKHSIRYATSLVVTRFLEVDIGKVVTSKLVPCGIKHVDDYLCMLQIAELKNVDVDKIAVEYLGKRLHVAASSRGNELKYLRYLSSSLIERLLPPENLKCRNCSVLLREILAGWVFLPLMDVLADPNIINSLVILITTYKAKPTQSQLEHLEDVEFMHGFAKKEFGASSLSSDLKTILRTPQLLYAFMQFLKKEDFVHILNFCLDIEAFNVKLLKPDLSKRQLEDLHTEALNLYKVYLDPKSVDFIGCSTDIVDNLCKLLEDGVYNVAKLQTSEPLFQAYDFAFNILEEDWMPQFHHSNEFYNYICGSKVTPSYTKTNASSPFITHGSPVKTRHKKYYESSSQGTVSKISSGLGRIRGALQTRQPVEGAALYPQESKIIDTETNQGDDVSSTPDYNQIYRDMSAWRVSIPTVENHQYGSKPLLTFNVNVQRIDTLQENETRHWIVKRREQDFYTLKARLVEFHGENEICNSPLPSRRANMSNEMRKSKYEDFLKKLLEKPSLKGSDLLHAFLTTPADFTLLVSTSSMPIVDLENIYQSVAYKLRKEKGQHLDAFMNTFLNSTGYQKPEKFEWAEIGEENPSASKIFEAFPKTMNNPVFKNNFNVTYKKDLQSSSSSINPNGITEAAFYLFKHIFKIPNAILKLYVAICSVAQQAVESMSRMFIDKKIKAALSQPKLAYLIKLLEDVIFDKHIPATPEELVERKTRAFKELDNAIPQKITSILGKDVKSGCAKILNILQNPLYNKQLAYSLIDIVVAEIYPELDVSEEFY